MLPTRKESEEFFKQLGSGEELSKLAQIFTENFMITGEETQDLQEVLQRASDSLIDMIWENIEEAETDSTQLLDISDLTMF
jgi:hypothetical protein